MVRVQFFKTLPYPYYVNFVNITCHNKYFKIACLFYKRIKIMLEICQLDFDYPDKPILQDVQFTLKPGCLLHLRGGNGVGKTTLLKLLAGILQPLRGDIRYNGLSITQDLSAYQHHICYVGHKTGVNQLLTVRENCRFELQRHPNSLPFDEIIRRFDLQGLEDIACSLLSAGQKRRVGLLRILLSDAALWLLDEPLVALDNEAIDLLLAAFSLHLNKGGHVILTSHQTLPLITDQYQEYYL